MQQFTPFPKIPRLNRDIVITEKLDGTNASIFIGRIPAEGAEVSSNTLALQGQEDGSTLYMMAGSRNKWITPGKTDNFGFAQWVRNNHEELFKLGEGHHFGEWYGLGIQRGYGLEERHFSLFNTGRWYDTLNHVSLAPACCSVVPILYSGQFSEEAIKQALGSLKLAGSAAAPRFMDPEGIIVYHTAANHCFKVTCKNDEKPKGET